MQRSRHFAIVLMLMILAGCGYRPLYGTQDQGANVESELAAIRVKNQSSRLGQLVRNELISQMGSGAAAAYDLELDVGDSTVTVISYPRPRTDRKAVELTVGYRLFGSDRRKALAEGRVKSKVSYDITDQPFADRQADADATERAAIEAAGDIRTRLAVYFSRR